VADLHEKRKDVIWGIGFAEHGEVLGRKNRGGKKVLA
jgi:hypothetical protein